MNLDSQELQRYYSHVMLDEIGLSGQIKLKNAQVLCIGAGGLASPLLYYLASAGIGKIGIVDFDKVELGNLSRQILYTQNDINKSKIRAAKNHLLQLNSKIAIQTYETKLVAGNAHEICRDYDVVADCSDNFQTKLLINDVCVAAKIPFVTASANRFKGSFAFFCEGYGPCYRCLFDLIEFESYKSCQETGVLNALLGILGSLQSIEIIKYLTNVKTQFNQYIEFNALNLQQKIFIVPLNPSCFHQHKISVQPQGASVLYKKISSLSEMNSHAFKLIDVRSQAEHQQFNLGGDCIPISELQSSMHKFSRSECIVLYCSTGKRSRLAAEFLQLAGFAKIYILDVDFPFSEDVALPPPQPYPPLG